MNWEMIVFTFSKRPYVLAFLISFLFMSVRAKGWRNTLFFLFSGYLIAWFSEGLSIRTGWPYGWYFYIYENLKGEWMNWGVPVWDSLSYTFLSFAGLSVAERVLKNPLPSPLVGEGQGEGRLGITRPLTPAHQGRGDWKLILLASFFVVILDIIVDPLAHLGDQWFLGKIYFYPHPGWYFDVPFSNFAGWFVVTALILWVNLWFQNTQPRATTGGRPYGVFLYFGIFFFNWAITLWLHLWGLALLDFFWALIPAGFLLKKSLKSP